MAIKFTRQPDGSYQESGDFQIGTRSVGLWIDGVRGAGALEYNAKNRLTELRETIKIGASLKAQVYELREVKIDPPELIERRVAALTKARKKKPKWEQKIDGEE